MVTHSYHFTTSHVATGGGHWVVLSMQWQEPDGNWSTKQLLPGTDNGDFDTGFFYAYDGEEIEWEFQFHLYGNHSWPLRLVAYSSDGEGHPWIEHELMRFNVSASGSPNMYVDNLTWEHDTAWKENSLQNFVGNYGNGIAKSYYWTITKDASSYVASPVYGSNFADWFYPNVSGDATYEVPAYHEPGTYQFEFTLHAAGESYPADNVVSAEQTFFNDSDILISDFYGVNLPAFGSPTFGLSARNHGPERGKDWWFAWIYNQSEDQWSDGGWMEVDFVEPGAEISFTRALPTAQLAQGWHYITFWSHYHAGNQPFEVANDAWFYVQPTQAPELILEDINSRAGGVRRDGSDDVLRMVEEDYDRAANIDLDFGSLNFSPNFPKWTLHSGAHQLLLDPGNPLGSFQGSQTALFSAEWTGGLFEDGVIEIVPPLPWDIHFSTDGIQGFIGAVNFTIAQLGGGEDRFHLVGNIGGSSKNVDHYNDGSRVSRKWSFDGNFGFKLDEIKDMQSPPVPVPGFPLVAVWAELEVGNLDATANFPGFGYDPSRPNPFSNPVLITASTDFKIKAAAGRELCSAEVAVKAGGSTNAAMVGTVDPRPDGIYLSGQLDFGQIKADLEMVVSGPFGCRIQLETDFVLLDPTSISLGDANGIKIYNFD